VRATGISMFFATIWSRTCGVSMHSVEDRVVADR
jgi:hypothetical protein